MTANQFTRIRKRLWRSQQAAADALGLTQGAIGHYESGRNPVPLIVIKLLKCLEASQ